MGEAKILNVIEAGVRAGVPIIGNHPRTPDMKQAQAAERMACRFADGMLEEGMKLDGPDKVVMTRLLAMRACTKVMARLARDEAKKGQTAASAILNQSSQFWAMAMQRAMVEEATATARLANDIAKATNA